MVEWWWSGCCSRCGFGGDDMGEWFVVFVKFQW